MNNQLIQLLKYELPIFLTLKELISFSRINWLINNQFKNVISCRILLVERKFFYRFKWKCRQNQHRRYIKSSNLCNKYSCFNHIKFYLRSHNVSNLHYIGFCVFYEQIALRLKNQYPNCKNGPNISLLLKYYFDSLKLPLLYNHRSINLTTHNFYNQLVFNQ